MEALIDLLVPYLPENASTYGSQVDGVIAITHLLMLILFVVWSIYFIYVLFRFSQSRNPKADYIGVKNNASTFGEVAVVIFEIVLLVAFSIPFWNYKVNAFPKEKDAVVIRIVAQQFAWNVHYSGADGKFGKADINLIDEQTNPIGLDYNDPDTKDDITTINVLNIPVDKPVIIYLSSKDVIHSFSLPVMRVKQDIIPGMQIPIWFEANKTGEWEIACAQLCGITHFRMRGYLNVKTSEEYEAWLAEEAALLEEQ